MRLLHRPRPFYHTQAAACAIVTCPRWPLRVAVIGILPAVNRLSGREAFAENN